ERAAEQAEGAAEPHESLKAEAKTAKPAVTAPDPQATADATAASEAEASADVAPAAAAPEQEQLDTGAEAENEDEPRVPSPRERLRNVFSSEIPANLMERPAAQTAAGAVAAAEAPAGGARAAEQAAAAEPPAYDVYAREEPRPVGTGSQPVIHPVIRVVGVGGAGVNAVNRMVEAEV